MVIRASSALQISTLLSELGADQLSTREAAIARLTIIGHRALDKLAALVASDADVVARVSALRVLEAIADPRAVPSILHATTASEPAVANAAIAASRPFLRGPHSVAVLDCLTLVVLDRRRDQSVREKALRLLRELESPALEPLLGVLDGPGQSTSDAPTASHEAPAEAFASRRLLHQAADGGVPESAGDLVAAVTGAGRTVALSTLLRLVERSREREATQPLTARLPWIELRGRIHATLAARGSRGGLYDVRESLLETKQPLPADFVTALELVGDLSCLEPLAAAYGRAARRHDVWREEIVRAARAIVERGQLTGRHGVVRRVRAKWPNFWQAVST